MFITQWEDRRPMVNEKDLTALLLVPDEMPQLAPIMVGGEIDGDALSEPTLLKIMGLNKELGEALFIMTDVGTVRMTRFQNMAGHPGQFVWDLMSYEQRQEMFEAEKERLGVKLYSSEMHDFYQSVCLLNYKQEKFVPQSGNIGMSPSDRNYINSCLVFNKALLYDVAPATFFCQFTFKGVKLKDLTLEQKREREKLHRPAYKYPTPDEMAFLHDL